MERPSAVARQKDASAPNVPGLGAIFLVLFLDILGFSLVLPFLAAEARNTFHTSEFTGTLLGAIYSLMQFLFVPVWGRVSDRVGRRPVLLWSVFATVIGMASLGGALIFASSVAWLFVARAASGIATANLGTASAYIADVTKPEDRARGMGVIGVAFGLGFILGPGIGGALAGVRILGRAGAVPCFIAAALSLVNLAWVFLRLRESLPPEKRGTKRRRLAPLDIGAARDAFARPGVALAIFVNFILVLSFAVLDQTFRFFNEDLFHMSAFQTGMVFTFIGVVAALVQGGLVRPLAKRFDEAVLVRIGCVVQSGGFLVLAASPRVGLWCLYAAGALLAIGNGLTQPSVSAYVSKRADPAEQGNTLGTSQSAAALARTFGPALGGFVYVAAGPIWPYIVSAIGMGIAAMVALRMRPANDPSTAPPGDQRKTSTQTS